jgi:hypothetical protein
LSFEGFRCQLWSFWSILMTLGCIFCRRKTGFRFGTLACLCWSSCFFAGWWKPRRLLSTRSQWTGESDMMREIVVEALVNFIAVLCNHGVFAYLITYVVTWFSSFFLSLICVFVMQRSANFKGWVVIRNLVLLFHYNDHNFVILTVAGEWINYSYSEFLFFGINHVYPWSKSAFFFSGCCIYQQGSWYLYSESKFTSPTYLSTS